MYQAILDKYAAPKPAEKPIEYPEEVAPQPAFIPPVETTPVFDTSKDAWKQYPAVVLLSFFLRENREMGIRLVLLDGRPTLHFCPGLDADTSSERMGVVGEAFGLLLDALCDLEYLIQTGKHVIPAHPGFAGAV